MHRDGGLRTPSRHDTAPMQHLEMIALSYVYCTTHDALKDQGRRFRPTVDAIVAAKACDRDTARSELAATLEAAGQVSPETPLVELYATGCFQRRRSRPERKAARDFPGQQTTADEWSRFTTGHWKHGLATNKPYASARRGRSVREKPSLVDDVGSRIATCVQWVNRIRIN